MSPPLRSLAAVLFALVPAAALGAEPAPAPDLAKERARSLLQEGNRLLDGAFYLEALAKFEAAFAVFPSPRLHFNIAQTCNELGRPLEALAHYELFVRGTREEDSPAEWRLAHGQIFRLQDRVALLEVQANVAGAQVLVDGAEVGRTPLPGPIRLLPGSHALALVHPGYERQGVDLKLAGGQHQVQRVALLTEEEAVASRKTFQQADRKSVV